MKRTKSLKDYLQCFNNEGIQILKCNEPTVIEAFQKGLDLEVMLYYELTMKEPLSMEYILQRARGEVTFEEEGGHLKITHSNSSRNNKEKFDNRE